MSRSTLVYTENMALESLLKISVGIQNHTSSKIFMNRLSVYLSVCSKCHHSSQISVKQDTHLGDKSSYMTFSQHKHLLHSSSMHCRKREKAEIGGDIVKPLFLLVEKYMDNTAVIDASGRHSYRDILYNSLKLSLELKERIPDSHTDTPLTPPRVGLVCNCNAFYIIGEFATLIAGYASVPLGQFHQDNYYTRIVNSSCVAVLASKQPSSCNILPVCKHLRIPAILIDQNRYTQSADPSVDFWDLMKEIRGETKEYYEEKLKGNFYADQTAVVLYRATGKSDVQLGVPLSHRILQTRLETLVLAMDWTSSDVSLILFSSYDYHNLITMVLLPLFCGASVVLHPKFVENEVWRELSGEFEQLYGYRVNKFLTQENTLSHLLRFGNEHVDAFSKVSLWYVGEYNKQISNLSEKWFETFKSPMYLMFGSAETGDILYTPIKSEYVNQIGEYLKLIPKVKARIYVNKKIHIPSIRLNKPLEGELQVRGPCICTKYENSNISKRFTQDNWFKTGNLAVCDNDTYQIIDPSIQEWTDSGFKISIGYLWHQLQGHTAISQIEFLRRPNHTRGESVIAVVVLEYGASLTLEELQKYSKEKFHEQRYFYQKPSALVILPSLPKNHQSKVNRRKLMSMLYFNENGE